jgi:Ca2+-binding EF-hand superfamily protein
MGRLYSKEEIEKIISSVDDNGDGLISIEEFSHLLN